MSTAPAFDQAKNPRRVIASGLGAVIEWYDFFLYGVVAGLFFNQLYFPGFAPHIGTMPAFAAFAVGFVARPLDGVIFGHFGDKIGRKKVLILTLEIMGAAVAIGCMSALCTLWMRSMSRKNTTAGQAATPDASADAYSSADAPLAAAAQA